MMNTNGIIAFVLTCIALPMLVIAEEPESDCAKCRVVHMVEEGEELLFCKICINPWNRPSREDIENICHKCGGNMTSLSSKPLQYRVRVGSWMVRLGIIQGYSDEILIEDDTSTWTSHVTVITKSGRIRVEFNFSLIKGLLCNITQSDSNVTTQIEPQTTGIELEDTTPNHILETTKESSTTTDTTTNKDELFSKNRDKIGLNALPIAVGIILTCIIIAGILGGIFLLVRTRKKIPKPDPLNKSVGSPMDNPVYFSPEAFTIGGKGCGPLTFGPSLNGKALSGSLRKY